MTEINDLDNTRTDTDAMFDRIVDTTRPEYILDGDENARRRLVRFADGEVIDLDPLSERPAHRYGFTLLHNVASYCAWIGDNIIADHQAAVYADRAGQLITAVLDDHSRDHGPGWRRFLGVYEVKKSPAWRFWSGISGNYYSAIEFAEIIEDWQHLIANPPTAELVDLVRGFRATRTSSFSDVIDDGSGDRALQWASETDTGELVVPDHVELHMPIYEGMDDYGPIEARFRYRISDGGSATFGVRIAATQEIEVQAFDQLAEEVAAGLPDDTPIYMGAAPAPTLDDDD